MDQEDLSAFVVRTFEQAGLERLRSDAKALDRYPFPDRCRRFLLDVGLPTGRPFQFDFSLVRTLPSIGELLDDHTLARNAGASVLRFPCIAESYGVVLALAPDADWAVRRLDLAGEQEPFFVNSRVELLGAALAEYVSLRVARTPALTDAERRDRLAERLTRLDPPAVERPDGWWLTVLEEIGFGLS